jgi:NAD-dependent SIR2 family protein deacetylase
VIENLENTLKKAKKFVFLTSAGISQESGISTFRGKDGLWQKDPMKLASAQAFRDDPKLVWSWYNDRRKNIMAAKPNASSCGTLSTIRTNVGFPHLVSPVNLLVTSQLQSLNSNCGNRK